MPLSTADEPEQGLTFAELIAPFSVNEFLTGVLGREWRHISGASEKVKSVLPWEEYNKILAMDVWSAQTMAIVLDGQRAPAGAYCSQAVNRSKTPGMYLDQKRVKELLRQGASLVLDDVHTLAPAIDRIAGEIRRALNGRVASNLYYSQQQRQAFKSHYDRHEVFALQVHGEKRWKIYKGRADAPIEHPRFLNIPQAEYDRMKGDVDREIVMKPGDVLYMPRGQFHDALASSSDSLHITFSCVVPMGLNLVQDMVLRLIDEPSFRQDLPRGDGMVGQAALKAHVDGMIARLSEIYSGENGLKIANQLIKGFSGEDREPFDIPNHRKR